MQAVTIGPVEPEQPKPVLPYYMGIKAHRFNIGEYVRFIPNPRAVGDYTKFDIGAPRTDIGIIAIKGFMRYDHHPDQEFITLTNNQNYLPQHLSYMSFFHCCGTRVDTVPANKRRFLKALWLILGGQSTTIYAGVAVADGLDHPHAIQFSSDWETVRVNLHPLRGDAIPTTLVGLRSLAKTFLKARVVLGVPTEDEAGEFFEHEKALTSSRVVRLANILRDAEANLPYAQEQVNEYRGYHADYVCTRRACEDSISLMSVANKDFYPLLGWYRDSVQNELSCRRDVDAKIRGVEVRAKELASARAAYDNAVSPKSCLPNLMRLVENKVVLGFGFEKGKLLVLFNGFDMPITPSPKDKRCKTSGMNICRCQIIVPGTIKIKPFIFFAYLDGQKMAWGVKKYRDNVIHPHFRSDGNYCLGGYQEAVDSTLKVFDLGGFFMVMADYIHSFNVHSMLSDGNKLDFVPTNPAPDRDGIFEQNPQNFESDDDSDDDECGDCGNRDCTCDEDNEDTDI